MTTTTGLPRLPVSLIVRTCIADDFMLLPGKKSANRLLNGNLMFLNMQRHFIKVVVCLASLWL